jgi:hypothetical protein
MSTMCEIAIAKAKIVKKVSDGRPRSYFMLTRYTRSPRSAAEAAVDELIYERKIVKNTDGLYYLASRVRGNSREQEKAV